MYITYCIFCLTKFCLLHAIVKFSGSSIEVMEMSFLKNSLCKKGRPWVLPEKTQTRGDMKWGPSEISRGIEEKVNGISRSQLKRKWNFQGF